MRYEWDENKRLETLRARGVDFTLMDYFEWSTALSRRSDRHGEARWATLGLIQGDLYHVAWTLREGSVRIISLRNASNKERDVYEYETSQDNQA